MGRTLKKSYKVNVYDDGTMDWMEITEKDPAIYFPTCPESIKQVMLVLEEAISLYHELWCNEIYESEDEAAHKAVTSAVNKIALKLKITSATVHTKITRYCGFDMSEFKEYVKDYYDCVLIYAGDRTPKFIDVLKSVVRGKSHNDKEIQDAVDYIDYMHGKILSTGYIVAQHVE